MLRAVGALLAHKRGGAPHSAESSGKEEDIMTLAELIIYLLIAAIVGLIAERLVGTGPYGLIGNISVGVIGIWSMLNLLHWGAPGDLIAHGVPILTAIIGAITVDLIVSALSRSGRGRALVLPHIIVHGITPSRLARPSFPGRGPSGSPGPARPGRSARPASRTPQNGWGGPGGPVHASARSPAPRAAASPPGRRCGWW